MRTVIMYTCLTLSSVILILVACAALLGCAPAPDGRVAPLAVRPPSLCADGGGCPEGLLCADDGHCGEPCGVNFACPLGYYCSARFPGHDCLPLCLRSDAGCQ